MSNFEESLSLAKNTSENEEDSGYGSQLDHSQMSPSLTTPIRRVNPVKNYEIFSTSRSSSHLFASPVQSGKRPFQDITNTVSNSKIQKLTPGNVKTASSPKSRTGWAYLLVRSTRKIQIQIMVRKANGLKGPFTSAAPNSKSRPAWDSVSQCEFQSSLETNGNRKYEFICTSSDKECHKFRVDLIDPFMNSEDSFTRKVSDLVKKNPGLLGHYITLMSRSKEFFNYSAEKHDDQGFFQDGSGISLADLEKAGGSLEELVNFIKAGEECCIDMRSIVAGHDERARSKKITEFFNTKEKVEKNETKKDTVEKNYIKEIHGEIGMERSLSSQYDDEIKMIPIDKLKKSPELALELNVCKVDRLVSIFKERFDPSLAVLTVSPSDFEAYENSGDCDQFYVIHGSHRLSAFEVLNKQGLLLKLPGMKGNLIACSVIKRTTAILTNYCNVRCNDLEANVKTEVPVYHMIFIYHGLLLRSKDRNQSKVWIERICHTQRLQPEDILSVLRICDWEEEALTMLIQVLDKYQNYLTTDISSRGDRVSIRRREPRRMTRAMLRSLSRVDQKFFRESYSKVLTESVSLKELIEENEKVLVKQKIMRNAAIVFGVENFGDIKTKYETFDESVLDNFTGAEVLGKKVNKQGENLMKYAKSIMTGERYNHPFIIQSCESIYDIDTKVIEMHDVLVFNDVTDGYLEHLIDLIGINHSVSFSKSVIVLVKTHQEVVKALVGLDSYKDKPEFSVHLIVFEKDKKVVNDFEENACFALIFGKISIVSGRIRVLNNSIAASLRSVVINISDSNAKIAEIIMDDVSCAVDLHGSPEARANRKITYYVKNGAVEKLKKKFLAKDSGADNSGYVDSGLLAVE